MSTAVTRIRTKRLHQVCRLDCRVTPHVRDSRVINPLVLLRVITRTVHVERSRQLDTLSTLAVIEETTATVVASVRVTDMVKLV